MIRVEAAESHEVLVNADVTVNGARALTNIRGELRIPWPNSEVLRLRVRQIGFRYVELVKEQPLSAGAIDTVIVALKRTIFALPQMIVQSQAHCVERDGGNANVLTLGMLELLRAGGERYAVFRDNYPFRVTALRRTVTLSAGSKTARSSEQNESIESSVWGDRYSPGNVLNRSANGFSVPVLFIATLADSAFWEHHCFSVRGVETFKGRRAVRLEFTPSLDTDDPDWDGAALIDSAAGQLMRVEFRLTNIPRYGVPRKLEGYTTFASPSPFIVIPESTLVGWWTHDAPTQSGWPLPTVAQLVVVTGLHFARSPPLSIGREP